MGIKGIKKLLHKKCKTGLYQTNIKQFANNIILIDTSIFLYKFKYFGDLKSNFTNFITKLLQHNITPIFVFDGRPTDNKLNNVLKERKEKRVKQQEKINKLKDELSEHITFVDDLPPNYIEINLPEELQEKVNKLQKLKKQQICVTYKDVKGVKELFDILGVLYIHVEYEADIVIPYIINTYNLKPLCISDDSDFLPHNINLISKLDIKTGVVEYIDIIKIQEELNVTRNEFIDMCVLMGCDYCRSIRGVGPMSAYKFIKQYKNLEMVFKKRKIEDTKEFIEARNIFIKPKIDAIIDIDFENLKKKKLDKSKFMELDLSEKTKEKMVKISSRNPLTKYFKVKK